MYSYSRYNDGLSDIEGGNHLRAGVGLSGGTMLTFNRLRFDTLTRKFVFYIKDSLSWNQSLLPHLGRRGDGLDFVQLTNYFSILYYLLKQDEPNDSCLCFKMDEKNAKGLSKLKRLVLII